MTFPYISVGGHTALRLASESNPWIDFVVFVPTGTEKEASKKMWRAMDRFYTASEDDYFELYSEYVDDEFPNSICLYHDSEDESEEYEEAWEEMLNGFNYQWAGIMQFTYSLPEED